MGAVNKMKLILNHYYQYGVYAEVHEVFPQLEKADNASGVPATILKEKSKSLNFTTKSHVDESDK
jgi:hypothetical protein